MPAIAIMLICRDARPRLSSPWGEFVVVLVPASTSRLTLELISCFGMSSATPMFVLIFLLAASLLLDAILAQPMLKAGDRSKSLYTDLATGTSMLILHT